MPTAAKLAAALAFAILGWLAANAYVPQMPEDTSVGYLREIVAALGWVIGWFTLGPALGRGYVDALSLGLRTSILLVFWALVGFSTYAMIMRSTRMLYNDAGEALLDIPIQMLQYGKLMGDATFLGILILGGILGGWAAEFAARRWK